MLVGSPKIHRTTERFFSPIVKIVPEGADVRFHFYDRDEIVSDLHNEIPVFGGSEIAGQGSVANEYVGVGDACTAQNFRNQRDETVTVLSTGDSGSVSGVFYSA